VAPNGASGIFIVGVSTENTEARFYDSFTMKKLPSGHETRHLSLRVRKDIATAFWEAARADGRFPGKQFEKIFEDWLRLTGRLRQAPEGLEEARVEPLRGSGSIAAESSQEQYGKKKSSGRSDPKR
jgi:hypothetical protein